MHNNNKWIGETTTIIGSRYALSLLAKTARFSLLHDRALSLLVIHLNSRPNLRIDFPSTEAVCSGKDVKTMLSDDRLSSCIHAAGIFFGSTCITRNY